MTQFFGAPVDEVDPPIHEELAPHPVSPYGASWLAKGIICVFSDIRGQDRGSALW